MRTFSSIGENLVPEQALQVQEDHEAWRRVRGGASPQHQLNLPLLARAAPALGGLHGQQGRSHASKQLHEQLRTLVSKPPASPGRDAKAPDDVSGLLLLFLLSVTRRPGVLVLD